MAKDSALVRNEASPNQLASAKLTPVMLNHVAWVTHDVAATANFYTRVMGMDLAHAVMDDAIPSTGDAIPYFHIFFRMQDGSTIAFFEAIGLPPRPGVSHRAYELFDHLALQAADRGEVDRWHRWLKDNDVDVVGPTDHNGLIYSIYFHDPNGLRLEITAPIDPAWNFHTDRAETDLKEWCAAKDLAVAENSDVGEALLRLIRERCDAD